MSLILSFITILKMPFGGSVTLGHMVPLILFAFKNGAVPGFYIGAIYGIARAMFSFFIVPVNSAVVFIGAFLLDYLVPYSLIGISCFLVNFLHLNKKNSLIYVCIFSSVLRLLSSVLSGVIIWSEHVPDNFSLSIWIYSILYNSYYMIPETLISLFICMKVYDCFDSKNLHTI